ERLRRVALGGRRRGRAAGSRQRQRHRHARDPLPPADRETGTDHGPRAYHRRHGARAASARESRMIVDIHAHYFPKAYNALLMRIGGKSLPESARALTARPPRDDDPSGIPTRLQQMDEAGVSMQVLSPAAS